MKAQKIKRIFSVIVVIFLIHTVKAQQPLAEFYRNDTFNVLMTCQTFESIDDYEENPVNIEFSKYGGWKAHQTTATGFFRVEKIDGRWWAIDPEGYYYIHKALNSVNTSNDLTSDESHKILDDHGFNGMGNWSNEETIESSLDEETPLAYCPRISFIAEYRRERDPRIEMPVFDDQFEIFCMELAKEFEKYVDDPQVFGYFSDNELDWTGQGLKVHIELLDHSDKNYITANNFLQERGKTKDNWGEDDENAYVALMGERYYSIVSAAIKSVDPNHMYLGSRCHSYERFNEDFVRNAGKYVDVFSNNYYNRWSPREFEIQNMAEWSGRPLIMTEFYAMQYSSEFLQIGAGFEVDNQRSRGLFYQNFISILAEKGVVVGMHWFKFQDDENGNKGVVNRSGDRQGTVLRYMEEMNMHLYDYIDYFDSLPRPSTVLTPESDAYYKNNTNFNNSELVSKFTTSVSVLRESYIKFDLSSLSGDINSAEIKLFSINTISEISEYQAELVNDDNWDESSITHSNSPDGSIVLKTWTDGGDITIDVTDELLNALDDNNKLTIRVVGTFNNGNSARFGSSEHPSSIVHPKLMIYSNSVITEIKDNHNDQFITFYPNPVSESLNITTTLSGNSTYEIINSLGAIESKGLFNKSKDQIDVSFLNHGVYMLKVSNIDSVTVYKFRKL